MINSVVICIQNNETMKAQINTTRAEFLKLRQRLSAAVRGHKLLKDKNEGLMKEFKSLGEVYKDIRQRVDVDLHNCMKTFALARLLSSSENIFTALEQIKGTLELTILDKSILNIKVPLYEVRATEDNSYSLIDTPRELDEAILQLKELFPYVVRVAELEQSILLLSKEIEKTRRRINALEYVMIPQLQDSIKSIKTKMNEIERSNINRLMKIKEMLVSKNKIP